MTNGFLKSGKEGPTGTQGAGGERSKPVRRFRGDGPFSGLRRRAENGERWAAKRLQWHVKRRLDQGWRHRTIAKRLRLPVAEIDRLADLLRPPTCRTFDPTARLVRRAR